MYMTAIIVVFTIGDIHIVDNRWRQRHAFHDLSCLDRDGTIGVLCLYDDFRRFVGSPEGQHPGCIDGRQIVWLDRPKGGRRHVESEFVRVAGRGMELCKRLCGYVIGTGDDEVRQKHPASHGLVGADVHTVSKYAGLAIDVHLAAIVSIRVAGVDAG